MHLDLGRLAGQVDSSQAALEGRPEESRGLLAVRQHPDMSDMQLARQRMLGRFETARCNADIGTAMTSRLSQTECNGANMSQLPDLLQMRCACDATLPAFYPKLARLVLAYVTEKEFDFLLREPKTSESTDRRKNRCNP